MLNNFRGGVKGLSRKMLDSALWGMAFGAGYKFGNSMAKKIDSSISNGIRSMLMPKAE
ncbi:MAG: hypothetical protein HN696_02250 [Euryarchaeota archaeon]|jgi:hypothetical protein|nr:hypothetical protein [Euryarchaeota archaeon]